MSFSAERRAEAKCKGVKAIDAGITPGSPCSTMSSGSNRQWLVVGGANAVAVAVLAEIECAVLVPHDWMTRLAGLALQLREWAGADVLVLHRIQGYRHAGHLTDFRSPDSGGADQEVRANAPPVRDHRPDATAENLDICQAGVGVENDAGRL